MQQPSDSSSKLRRIRKLIQKYKSIGMDGPECEDDEYMDDPAYIIDLIEKIV